jgi:hypothetical protein
VELIPRPRVPHAADNVFSLVTLLPEIIHVKHLRSFST